MGKRTKENYELASQRYLDILNDIHKNPDTIKNMLDSSCRLYRYDFAEQMMIVSANRMQRQWQHMINGTV